MTRKRIGEVLELRREQVVVDPLATYREIGVRSFGRGIFHKEPLQGHELGTKRVFWVRPDDLIFNNVFAWEGAVALATDSEAGMIGSHRFLTYVPKDDSVDPAYLRYFFATEKGVQLLGQASPGSAGRNRTLAIDRFEALEIPLPDIADQRRIAARLDSLLAVVEQLRVEDKEAVDVGGALLDSGRSALIADASGDAPVTRLGEVAEIVMGQSPPGYAYNEVGDGMPLLNGPTEFGRSNPVPRQWTSVVTKVCEPGDLLMSVRASIGRTNWADTAYCLGRGVAALRPKSSNLDLRYLRQLLLAKITDLTALSAGSTFLNLPGHKLRTLELPLLSLTRQAELSDRLDALEDRHARVLDLMRKRRVTVAGLRESILNNAFAGAL